MNNAAYNNAKDNLKQLQGEIDKIVSAYQSLVNANKIDLEHINVLYDKLNSIVTQARDELKNVDFLRVSETEEDNVMYDNLQAEKTGITNHPIRHAISQERHRLERIVGIKEKDGKYSLTDEKRKEIKDKLEKKHKYESEIKKQKEEIKELQEKLGKETDEHIIKNIKAEIEEKNKFIEEYVTEMKKIRKELIEERRKAKSLFDEDVKVENGTYTRTDFNPFIEEESIDGKKINPLRNISDIEEEDRKIIEERRAKYEKFKPITPPQPEKSMESQEENKENSETKTEEEEKMQEQQPEQKEMTEEEIEQAINDEIDEQEAKENKEQEKEQSNVPINKGKKTSIALKSIGKFALKVPGAIIKFAIDMVGEIVEFAKAVYEKVK
jgi:hypothetical protein